MYVFYKVNDKISFWCEDIKNIFIGSAFAGDKTRVRPNKIMAHVEKQNISFCLT